MTTTTRSGLRELPAKWREMAARHDTARGLTIAANQLEAALTSREAGEGEAGDSALLSLCYAAMRDAMQVIDPNEGPGREHSRILNALADCRVKIENRNALRAGLTRNEFGRPIAAPPPVAATPAPPPPVDGSADELVEEMRELAGMKFDAGCCNSTFPILAVRRVLAEAADRLAAAPVAAAQLAEGVVDENARLREALSDLLSWFPDKPSPPEWRIEAGERGADDAVAAARAALHPTSGQGGS